MTLAQLQQQFIQMIEGKNYTILKSISPTLNNTPAERMAIYKNSIQGARQKQLRKIYPVCYKLVGDYFFNAMANDYMKQFPSQKIDLTDYGNAFAEWIKTFPHANSLIYLSDVAKLEWAWYCNQIVYVEAPFDLKQFMQYCKEHKGNSIFALLPASSLLQSPYPLHQIWETNQDDYLGETHIKLPENKQFFYFIWQSFQKTQISLLEEPQWYFLYWIQQKHTLAEICERYDQKFQNHSIDLLLSKTIQKKWIFC